MTGFVKWALGANRSDSTPATRRLRDSSQHLFPKPIPAVHGDEERSLGQILCHNLGVLINAMHEFGIQLDFAAAPTCLKMKA